MLFYDRLLSRDAMKRDRRAVTGRHRYPVDSCTDPQRHFPRLRRGPALLPVQTSREAFPMSTPNVPPGAISLPEWEGHMDAGATTYTVGSREPLAVYLDRAEAEAAADRAWGPSSSGTATAASG